MDGLQVLRIVPHEPTAHHGASLYVEQAELKRMFGDHLFLSVQGRGDFLAPCVRLFRLFYFHRRTISVSCTWQAAYLRPRSPAYLDLTSHSIPLGTSSTYVHVPKPLPPQPIGGEEAPVKEL